MRLGAGPEGGGGGQGGALQEAGGDRALDAGEGGRKMRGPANPLSEYALVSRLLPAYSTLAKLIRVNASVLFRPVLETAFGKQYPIA